MTTAIEGLKPTIHEYALELLAHQPDPIIFCLPVWDTGEANRRVIDFHVSFANQKAAAAFHIVAGQLLRNQTFEHSSRENAVGEILFHQLQDVAQYGTNNEQHYFNARTKTYFSLRCSKVKDGVKAIAH